MPLHGTGAHPGAAQNAAAQATFENAIPTILANTTYTTDEVAVVGLPNQTVVMAQAAAGNPGVTVQVQFVERGTFFTVDTFALVPGAANVVWQYHVPARAMRLRVVNPAGAASGIITTRILAAQS